MDIFISYSTKDKNVADAVCHVMEENNITCWVSPRDVQPGINYAKQIIQAIRDCKVFVLIFSKESNESEHVGNEVDSAFKANKPIIPFVIEKTDVNEELDYYLSRKHWLVGYPDYREKTKDLLMSVRKLIDDVGGHTEPDLHRHVFEEITFNNTEPDNKKVTKRGSTTIFSHIDETIHSIISTLKIGSTFSRVLLLSFSILGIICVTGLGLFYFHNPKYYLAFFAAFFIGLFQLCGIFKLLVNKVEGFYIFISAPIIVIPFILSLGWYRDKYLFVDDYAWIIRNALLYFIASSLILSIILIIRKNGKPVWSLLSGKLADIFSPKKSWLLWLSIALLLFMTQTTISCWKDEYHEYNLQKIQIEHEKEVNSLKQSNGTFAIDSLKQENTKLRHVIDSKEEEIMYYKRQINLYMMR